MPTWSNAVNFGKAVERPLTVAIDETFKKAPKAKGKAHEQSELL